MPVALVLSRWHTYLLPLNTNTTVSRAATASSMLRVSEHVHGLSVRERRGLCEHVFRTQGGRHVGNSLCHQVLATCNPIWALRMCRRPLRVAAAPWGCRSHLRRTDTSATRLSRWLTHMNTRRAVSAVCKVKLVPEQRKLMPTVSGSCTGGDLFHLTESTARTTGSKSANFTFYSSDQWIFGSISGLPLSQECQSLWQRVFLHDWWMTGSHAQQRSSLSNLVCKLHLDAETRIGTGITGRHRGPRCCFWHRRGLEQLRNRCAFYMPMQKLLWQQEQVKATASRINLKFTTWIWLVPNPMFQWCHLWNASSRNLSQDCVRHPL